MENKRQVERYEKYLRHEDGLFDHVFCNYTGDPKIKTYKDSYNHWIKYYQKQIDNNVLPPEDEWYKQESIKDRFGNELYIGDIILVGGDSLSDFQEYFISKITKTNIMRFHLNGKWNPNYTLWKDPTFSCKSGQFNYLNFDFIIIKEEYLSKYGKENLEKLNKHKWFRDDYMQRCDRERYSNW